MKTPTSGIEFRPKRKAFPLSVKTVMFSKSWTQLSFFSVSDQSYSGAAGERRKPGRKKEERNRFKKGVIHIEKVSPSSSVGNYIEKEVIYSEEMILPLLHQNSYSRRTLLRNPFFSLFLANSCREWLERGGSSDGRYEMKTPALERGFSSASLSEESSSETRQKDSESPKR